MKLLVGGMEEGDFGGDNLIIRELQHEYVILASAIVFNNCSELQWHISILLVLVVLLVVIIKH